MTAKDRQRQRERISLTPQGQAPNWLLVAVAAAFTVAALLAPLLG
jgi:hypothetical protein